MLVAWQLFSSDHFGSVIVCVHSKSVVTPLFNPVVNDYFREMFFMCFVVLVNILLCVML